MKITAKKDRSIAIEIQGSSRKAGEAKAEYLKAGYRVEFEDHLTIILVSTKCPIKLSPLACPGCTFNPTGDLCEHERIIKESHVLSVYGSRNGSTGHNNLFLEGLSPLPSSDCLSCVAKIICGLRAEPFTGACRYRFTLLNMAQIRAERSS